MTRQDWRKTALGALAVGWGGIVFAVYYYVHKPVTLEQAVALARLATTLAGWLGTLVLAHAFGRVIAPSLSELPARERLALRIGLGLGGVGLCLLALGFVRGYYPPLAWAIVLVAIYPGMRPFLSDLRDALPQTPQDSARKALASFVVLTLALISLRALAPPIAWDSLVYHLTGPKLYLQWHGIEHSIDLAYLGFPQWGSMLFTWGMLLAGPSLAQSLHFTFALLSLALLTGLTDRIAPGRGWLAAALCLAVPTAALLAAWAYVEWLTIFAGLAAFECLQRASGANVAMKWARPSGFRTDDRQWAVLAGAFTGLAMAAKYTSLGLALGLGVLAMLWLKSGRLRFVFLFAAAMALGPYLFKNLILTGNPVYPFFFPGMFWDAARSFWYGRSGTGLSLPQLLAAPWDATVWSTEGAILLGRPSYGATIGPLLLTLVPFSALGWRDRASEGRRVLGGVVMVSGIGYLVWLAQLGFSGLLVQSRLLLPLLPFFVALAVKGFDSLGRLATWLLLPRFVVGGMVGLALSLAAVEGVIAFAAAPPLAVVLGIQSESDYLAGRLGMYELAMEAVNDLPSGSRIAFLWEPRTFHCQAHVTCEPDAILDRWWHLRRTVGDAEAIAERWKADGVTHVLLYWPGSQTGEHVIRAAGFDPLTDADWGELEQLVEEHAVPVTDLGGVYVVYRLR